MGSEKLRSGKIFVASMPAPLMGSAASEARLPGHRGRADLLYVADKPALIRPVHAAPKSPPAKIVGNEILAMIFQEPMSNSLNPVSFTSAGKIRERPCGSIIGIGAAANVRKRGRLSC